MKSLMNFLLWINIKRPIVNKRLNNWEILLNHKFQSASKEDKKKFSSFKNKIKKLKALRIKK